jgi:hypothetical protein
MAEEWWPVFKIGFGPEEVDGKVLCSCHIEAVLEACMELQTTVHVAGGDFDQE